jgi:hypothetical protein
MQISFDWGNSPICLAKTELHIEGGAASEKLPMYSKDLEITTGGGIKLIWKKVHLDALTIRAEAISL